MGLLTRLLGMSSGTSQPNPTADFWFNPVPVMTSSGRIVTAASAMQQGTVYSCVRILAEAVSSLPLKLYSRDSKGGKEPATNHPLYATLHESPNKFMTAMEFWELSMQNLALRGNFLCDKRTTSGGMRIELDPVFIDNVKEVDKRSDSIYYEITEDRKQRTLSNANAFHVRAMSLREDNAWGHNPVEAMRNAIGMADAAELMGASFFKNGMRPSGVLEYPNELSEEAFARLQKSITEAYTSAMNTGRPYILEEGAKWHSLSITPEDAQFLETRKFQKEEIASLFRVPMHMLNALERATFSNIEHQSLEFVIHTLRPWLVRIEQAIKRDLISQQRFFAEFVVDALLRGDTASRYEAYGSAIQNEWMSKNEVRQRENLNPVDGGDEFKNPAINPQGQSEQNRVSQGNEKGSGRAEKVSQAFATDIAGRIAEIELKTLRQRSKHAESDRDKFNEWAASFYEDHAKRFDKSLDQFCEAFDIRPTERAAIVEEAIIGSLRALKSAEDVPALLESWESQLSSHYADKIKGMVA